MPVIRFSNVLAAISPILLTRKNLTIKTFGSQQNLSSPINAVYQIHYAGW